MDGETVDTVTGWESEPLSGGIDGLRALASREFTGAVTEGRAWLFMLNGRVVGVFDGSLDSFEGADATAYAAPDPSLPLLYAMRGTGGETKARYYTNDTALSAADAKLSSGKFTGYVELSENVLSGDYYALYYGGRRLACAFVGTGEQKQVLTGDEAFEAADEEVGIYEVVDVDIDVVEIPDPEPDPVPEPEPGRGADSPARGEDVGDADRTAAERSTGHDAEAVTFGGADGTDSGAASDTAATRETGTAREPATASDGRDVTDTADSPDTGRSGGRTGPTGEADAADADARTGNGSAEADARPASRPDRTERADGAADESAEDPATAGAAADGEATDANGDPFSAEEQWRETKSIPSLDPSRTSMPEDEAAANGGRRRGRPERSGSRSGPRGTSSADGTAGKSRRGGGTGAGPTSGRDAGPATPPGGGSGSDTEAGRSADGAGGATDADSGSGADGGPTTAGSDTDGTEATPRALAKARAERDRAREALHEARGDLDATEEEVSRLREENERLADRVDELESALAETREELRAARETGGSGDSGGAAGRSVPADRALEGTNLFVRYDSKGGATLSKAHAGGVTRSDVNDNLRLELHTDFETGDVVVDGEPYREFLTGTIEYSFVEWVVRELLYEIQGTGNESALRDLFDAIPDIDRAELAGTVELDGGEGEASAHRFDVVLRDRMGNPLVVANVTEGRDATTESMLDSLVGEASTVGEATDHLAAGFYVTASYFEPGALEAAADATGGGLLSRGKRKSFVKLARKQGFHLCLVESREGEFHVNVPEL